jgi:5-bromo-4-chloroindolyl phosphate hydrolysis protein
MDEREARVARNESISREINEELEDAQASAGAKTFLRLACECGHEQCNRLLALTIREYEQIREDPRRFAVAKEHVMPDVELVVRDTNRFTVVEKRPGTPAVVAEELDPRG